MAKRLKAVCVLAAPLWTIACGEDSGNPSIPPSFQTGAGGTTAPSPASLGGAAGNAEPTASPVSSGGSSGGTEVTPIDLPRDQPVAPNSGGSGGAATPPTSGSPPSSTPPSSYPVFPGIPPDGAVGPAGRQILDFASLKEAAAASGRRIGVAIDGPPLGEAEYRTVAAREFNYVTPANEMKWDAVQPQPGQFNYARADQIVQFAEQNGMSVKGHTLLWFRQLPGWVQQLNSAANVRSAMLTHIQTVVSRFRGRVVAWDVVNEAWNDDGLSMRDVVFQRFLGDGYVDEAFRAARAADPDAKLYYNDFGTEDLSPKSDAVYEMLQGMIARGVPIDGVGLQMHTININGAPTVADFIANVDRLAALGLDVVISELDISTCSSGGSVAERLEAQRLRAYNLVAACVARPACSEITFWGVTDRYSWLDTNPDISQCENGQEPLGLLFDYNYQPKPAYSAVRSAFRVAR